MHPIRILKLGARGSSGCWSRLGIAALIVSCFFLLRVSPAEAVDNVPYYCDGHDSTNGNCTLFQLDEVGGTMANADTCVGSEGSPCSANPEKNPVWPADWDALLYPSLSGSTITPTPRGGAPGAGTFTLPWTGGYGAFSGIYKSTFVDSVSTILKQGSKNSNDISTWVVAQQHSPPKDAIIAAAIATYVGPPDTTYAGHELLYHAATRYSPNGSATEGIWLFKEPVEICPSGTALCDARTGQLAHHSDGDVFLFISYGGSGFASIQVAKWENGSLVPAGTVTVCPTANDDACAVTNEASSITLGTPTGFQAPGTGFNVSGTNFPGFPGGVVPPLQFQEGGVDLNAVLGGPAPCFSSVMFASVSSGSSPATASLKAIILGSLNTCAISATKSCGTGTANFTTGTVTYPISGVVTNIGGGAVQNLSLSDMFSDASQSFDSGYPTCSCGSTGCTITGSDCSTVQLDPGGTVSYAANITTSNNGGSDIITASMSGSGGGSATAQSNTATCNALTFPASVTISKSCGNTDVSNGAALVAQDGLVAVKVGVSGTVKNASADLPLSSVTVYDCVGGTFAAPGSDTCPTVAPSSCSGTLISSVTTEPSSSIAPSGSSGWSDTYFPSVAPSCGPYNFDDQVLVTASCTSQFCDCPTVQNVANATCPLCPGPDCPTSP